MNILKISLKNLTNKAQTNSLSILLMALGVCIIAMILTISKQLDEKFTKNIKGIDMVVGAKGSPLQLILSCIYQIDAPTGNIPYDEAMRLSKNPFIKKAIPISMGDSYLGYRIIGTNEMYLANYQATMATGLFPQNPLQCVIGATAAKQLNLKIGDTFSSAHGLNKEGDRHDAEKYTVIGILNYSNSVADMLIITSLESIWKVHEHSQKTSNAFSLLDETQSTPNPSDKQITALLVKFRSPMGLMTIPRNINANTTMQAALPAIEINRLFSLMGIGVDLLKWIAIVIIMVSGLSVFLALYNSLKERRYEMAVMLSMGATRTKLFLVLLIEGLIIGFSGYILGIFMSKIGLYIFSKSTEQDFHIQINFTKISFDEILILSISLLVCFFASAIPSFGIYKINISKTLSEQ